MFGIGVTELLIVGFIVLVIFGAGKIPEIMGNLGSGLRDFKNGIEYDPKTEESDVVDADFKGVNDGR